MSPSQNNDVNTPARFTTWIASTVHVYLRHSPVEIGKWRLYRLFAKLLERPFTETTIRTRYGHRITLRGNQFLERYIYDWGTWQEFETRLLLACLKPGDVFVDVGANIGHFTLTAARKVGPKGHVYAVEATPPTMDRLKRHVVMNKLTNVTLCACAVADRTGTVKIGVPQAGNVGANTIRESIGGEAWDVPCETLDVVLGGCPVSVMKIDIEGAELLALKGAKNVLSSPSPPVLILEIYDKWIEELGGKFEELITLLQQSGYEPYLIDEEGLATTSFADLPRHRQFDLLCKPPSFKLPRAIRAARPGNRPLEASEAFAHAFQF